MPPKSIWYERLHPHVLSRETCLVQDVRRSREGKPPLPATCSLQYLHSPKTASPLFKRSSGSASRRKGGSRRCDAPVQAGPNLPCSEWREGEHSPASPPVSCRSLEVKRTVRRPGWRSRFDAAPLAALQGAGTGGSRTGGPWTACFRLARKMKRQPLSSRAQFPAFGFLVQPELSQISARPTSQSQAGTPASHQSRTRPSPSLRPSRSHPCIAFPSPNGIPAAT